MKINKMCEVQNPLLRIFIILGVFQLSNAAFLRCYKGSLDDYTETPLETPLQLIGSSCIDQSLPTVFYTFGYRGLVDGPATTAMLLAYLNTDKRNVILVNWQKEAMSGALGIALGYGLSAVPNAKKVGTEFGSALVQLARAGLNMTQVHLLGHSLGAHLMGHAGRQSRTEGFVVPRITGLDPARALFEGFAIQSGLDRTCARFVDIIHSDPGGYGISKPSGTVDFWPNYVGKKATQPGCPEGTFEQFSVEDLCSHDRSWRFYSEAISSPTSFLGAFAADYETWTAKDFVVTDTAYLGDLTSTSARGNYYLTTESQTLFGRGIDGTVPDSRQSRKRRTTALADLLSYLR